MSTTFSNKTSPAVATSTNPWSVVIPYAVGILSQVPLLLLYARGLWGKSHYQFFPVAILAIGAFIYLRWPRSEVSLRRNWTSNVLLGLGVFCGLLAALYVEPWFAALASLGLLASFLARVPDLENNKTLLPVALLGLICITPLRNLDQTLITWLQQVSARITSLLLDLVGYAHYMPGTVILAPGTSGFGIEEACSGVQSFFTLLFVAAFFVVLFRRPWFRGTLLLATVVFWAIFMNTLRIFLIPMADRVAGIDLAHNLPHDLLGYSTLFLGILMVYSSDQFLLFLFGPTDQFGDDGRGMLNVVGRFWNWIVAGQPEDERKRRPSSSVNRRTITTLWVVTGVLAVFGLMSLTDTIRSMLTPEYKIRFFDSNMIVPLAKSTLPADLGEGDWKLADPGYETEDRSRNSDLGQFSNSWTYLAKDYRAQVSFDQPFPGWHELTTCYRNMGWEVKTRRLYQVPASETTPAWSYVAAELRNNVGQTGYVVFGLFDSFGEPYDPPENSNSLQWLITGATNRLNHRIRGRLFRGESYQFQVFVAQYRPFSEEIQENIRGRFLELWQLAREDFLKRRKSDSGLPADVAANEPSSLPNP